MINAKKLLFNLVTEKLKVLDRMIEKNYIKHISNVKISLINSKMSYDFLINRV